LRHSKVQLSWDADPPERVKITRKRLTKDDIKEMDFTAYLASSGSESEDNGFNAEFYRKTLLGNHEKEDSKNIKEEDMEITFTPGLSELGSDLLKKKEQKDKTRGETVFETYLREKNEKKKERKKSLKAKVNDNQNEEELRENTYISGMIIKVNLFFSVSLAFLFYAMLVDIISHI